MLLIGIDGGGSKNDLLLFDEHGTILHRVISIGTNASELGTQETSKRLSVQLTELLCEHDGLNTPIDALFAGISGGGNPDCARNLTEMLNQSMPHAHTIRFAGDTLTALYAGIGLGDGMAVIAGTGSSTYVRHQDKYSLVGGWGHLIDDAGSGFWLGKEALNAALRNLDGRGTHTLLTELVNQAFGGNVRLSIPEIYQGGKRKIASLAPLVFEAAQHQDGIALDILSRAADELALMIRAGASLIEKKPWRVALVGGLWKSDLLFNAVQNRLNSDYLLMPLTVPPVFGSALAAAEDAGIPVTEAFRKNLLNGLETFI